MRLKTKKAIRLVSKYANRNKQELVTNICDRVKRYRNEMSLFCYQNLNVLWRDPVKFVSNYRQWRDNDLNAHTIQTLFKEIIDHYINYVKSLVTSIAQAYRKLYRQSCILYCSRFAFERHPFDDLNFEEFEKLLQSNRYSCKVWEVLTTGQRKLAYLAYRCLCWDLKSRLRPIVFRSGSFRLTVGNGYSYKILHDPDNKLFKWFLEIPFGKGKLKRYVRVPLLIEDEYPTNKWRTQRYYNTLKQNLEHLDKQIWVIDRRHKTNSKKLIFAVTTDVEIEFKDYVELVGVDVNLSRETFFTCSTGQTLAFQDKYLVEFLDFIEQLDRKGYQNITKREKRKLKHLVNKVRWFIEAEIASFIRTLKAQGVTDIALENLEPITNGKFKVNLFGRKLKLNRFVRLLHLVDLKNIFVRIANNNGIRVHLVDPAYTSQQCPVCGHIDKLNRKSQSVFKCKNCNYQNNADLNAAINIGLRIANPEYRDSLHIKDKTGQYRPYKLKHQQLKSKLLDSFKPVLHVATQLLPDFSYKVSLSGFLAPELSTTGDSFG